MYDLPPEYYRWLAAAKKRGGTTYQEMVDFLQGMGQVPPEVKKDFLQLIHASGIEVRDTVDEITDR